MSTLEQQRAFRESYRELKDIDTGTMEKAMAILRMAELVEQGMPHNETTCMAAPSDILIALTRAENSGASPAAPVRQAAGVYFVALGKSGSMTQAFSYLLDMTCSGVSDHPATSAAALDGAALLARAKPDHPGLQDVYKEFTGAVARHADETVRAALKRFETAAGQVDPLEKGLVQLFQAGTTEAKAVVLRDLAAQVADERLSPIFNAATAQRGFELVRQAAHAATAQKDDDNDKTKIEIAGAATDLFNALGRRKDSLPFAIEGLCALAIETMRPETATTVVRLATDLFRAHPDFEGMHMAQAVFRNMMKIERADLPPETLQPVRQALYDMFVVYQDIHVRRQLGRAATEPSIPASRPAPKG